MPIPETHRNRALPFRLAHGRIDGFHEAQAAAVDMQAELLFHKVKARLANDLMVSALAANCPHPFPGQLLRALREESANEAGERQKRAVREITSAGMKQESDGLGGFNALACVIKCLFHRFKVDTNYREIDCDWTGIIPNTPRPGTLTIPYGSRGSAAEVGAILFQHLGPVAPFCKSVHGQAKEKDLLPAFLAAARFAPARAQASALSEEAELVIACLNVQCWPKEVDSVTGAVVTKPPNRLEAVPGIYPNEGLAYIADDDTGSMMLYVLPGAVLPKLPRQFQHKRVGAITELLKRAPGCVKTNNGYSSPRRVRERFGNPKSVGINVTLFRQAIDQAEHDAATRPQEKALDPEQDGRDAPVIVTPYYASPEQTADHTAYMLAPVSQEPKNRTSPTQAESYLPFDAPRHDDGAASRLVSGRMPHANQPATTASASLTLLDGENAQSFREDTRVSGATRDQKSGARLPSDEKPSKSARMGWQQDGSK